MNRILGSEHPVLVPVFRPNILGPALGKYILQILTLPAHGDRDGRRLPRAHHLPRRPGLAHWWGTEEPEELWRNDDIIAFTSSPVLVGDRYFQTILTGELFAVDAVTGESLWHEKLGSDQIHASPAWGDGKLYVPMNDGTFHIIRPGDDAPESLCKVQLAGNCLGAPAIAGGCIYVHTTEKLYCFGEPAAELPWRLAIRP